MLPNPPSLRDQDYTGEVLRAGFETYVYSATGRRLSLFERAGQVHEARPRPALKPRYYGLGLIPVEQSNNAAAEVHRAFVVSDFE